MVYTSIGNFPHHFYIYTDVFEMVFTHFCYTIILYRVGKYYEIEDKKGIAGRHTLFAPCSMFFLLLSVHTLPAISRDERNACEIYGGFHISDGEMDEISFEWLCCIQ